MNAQKAFFDASEMVWRISSRSVNGDCVQVAVTGSSQVVLVRDSKDPGGPALSFEPGDWQAFVTFVKLLR